MAEIHGKGGSVTSSGGNTTVNSWTLSYVGDAVECTNFDSTGGREYIAGLTGWSGSYDCFFSTGNTLTPGNSKSIRLTVSTGTTGGTIGKYAFTGTAIITGMDITAPVDGIVTQGYTFQGTNALSVS
ncbi:hypothetical protein ES705_45575 [subsurface metagenome]